MNNDFKFSVLMSVYIKEKAEYLKQSLDSIFSQLLMPDQVVLVEDGPLNDELYSVIRSFSNNPIMKIVKIEKNMGLTNALNEGLKFCDNNLVARMDSDDIASRERFIKQIAAFKENPNCAIIGSDVIEFFEDSSLVNSKRVMPKTHEQIIEFSRKRNPFNHPSVMYKKDIILSVGGYEDFPYFEDYNLWVKVLQSGYETLNLAEYLVKMRTPLDFYKRRGGYKYFKHMRRFKKHLYSIGHMNLRQYAFNVFAHSAIALSPTFIRKIIYTRFLRKK